MSTRRSGLVAIAVASAALCAACGPSEPQATPAPAGGAAPDADVAPRALSPELQAFAGLEGTIAISGGTAHIPVMEKAAARIQAVNPKVRITVAGGGSGVGIQQAGEGLVDIGNSGRALSEDESTKLGLVGHAFAIDGVAVVVHPTNPVRALTSAQIRDLYAGKIADWSAVGGTAGAVNLFTRDEASGTRETFWTILLRKGEVAKGATVVASNGAMKTAVAGDPRALGYTSIGHVDATVRALQVDGVDPTQESASSGRYAVTRKLWMTTKGEPKPLVRAFLGFIFSAEGAEYTRAAGYIPVPRPR